MTTRHTTNNNKKKVLINSEQNVNVTTPTQSPKRPGAKGQHSNQEANKNTKDLIHKFTNAKLISEGQDACIKMTKEKSTANLLEETDPLILEALKRPTELEVITFKRHVVNAPPKCGGASTSQGGHIHLILNKTECQKRINKPNVTLPADPAPPILPTGAATTGGHKIRNEQEKASELHTECKQQLKDVLLKKFPDGSVGLLDDDSNLECGTTPKEILKNVKKKPVNADEVNETHLDLLNRILKHPHIQSANGAEEWFKETKADSQMMVKLGHNAPQHSVTTVRAQQAFKQSGHDMKDVMDMAKDWK